MWFGGVWRNGLVGVFAALDARLRRNDEGVEKPRDRCGDARAVGPDSLR